VAKQAVWLSGWVEFETAEDILNRVGHIAISDTSVWRRAKKWGERSQAVEATERASATAIPPRSEIVAGEAQTLDKMGVGMDGAMVHIRQEGWKELKVGCVFEIEVRPTRDKHTREVVDLAHAVRNSYVAHLGGPETLGALVWTEARRRHWTQARDTIALGDGAAWVWNLVKEHFFDSRQCVDWYHATEHLSNAANVLKGDGTPAAQKWFKDQKTPLFEGQADQIVTRLRQAAAHLPKIAEALRREAGYFKDNSHRMQYLETREEGFPIGSGMVECGCKQFRARFAGPGMRWSRLGLERLLPVRAAIMSHSFDQLWRAIYRKPPK
jgi:hypothetical protein